MNKVEFIIGWSGNNYSGIYSDDEGCVAVVGDTLDELKEEAASGLQFHIDGLKEDGIELPEHLQGEYELIFKDEKTGEIL